jgi:hypothetical protein
MVPDLNQSLSVRDDDGIRSLVNNEPEKLNVFGDARPHHGN